MDHHSLSSSLTTSTYTIVQYTLFYVPLQLTLKLILIDLPF